MEEVKKDKELEVKNSEIAVTLTKEVAEKIEEMFQKAIEKRDEAQKQFRFHGSKETELKATKAEKRADAAEFIRAVARGDVNKAVEFSDARLKKLQLDRSEIIDRNIYTKAISSGGSAGSEFLVPEVFEADILETFDTYDEIISDADVRDFNRPGNIFNLNELDTRVVVWPSDENATGMTASQPTYSEPQIGLTDWLGSTTITLDFLEDTEVDIMSDLSRQFGEEMAKKIQARLINGDVTVSGVVTKGVLNTPGLNEVLIANTTGGFTTVTANDIENAFFDAISVDHFQRENQNGTWYMNAVTLYNLRKNIRSSSSDRDYLSIFDPVKMTLMGRPLKLTNQFPTPTTTTSDPFVLYGNLRNHLKIRRKRGITMKVNDQGTTRDGRNLNYQLGRELVVSQRIGHQVVLAEGLTVLAT
jgi:HK97 family phage major capsid protein